MDESNLEALANVLAKGQKKIEEQARNVAEAPILLAEFIANGPLYVEHNIHQDAASLQELPAIIKLHCLTCGSPQNFEIQDYSVGNRMTAYGWSQTAQYTCRNCKRQRQKYMYTWTQKGFSKVGQTPAVPEIIDSFLNKGLGKSSSLYRKALRSRSFGFGIGALAYLRRVIEDTTDQLMSLLREENWENWSEQQRKEYDTAVTTYRYSEKIAYAATKVLPAGAFASGKNSFATLHDVTSSGIHSKTEEECLELFDSCHFVFQQTFRILYMHKQGREEFEAQLGQLKR